MNKNIRTTINYNKLDRLCNNVNWNTIYSHSDLNKATDFLVTKIKNVVNLSVKKNYL